MLILIDLLKDIRLDKKVILEISFPHNYKKNIRYFSLNLDYMFFMDFSNHILLTIILAYLNPIDLTFFSQTCKRFRTLFYKYRYVTLEHIFYILENNYVLFDCKYLKDEQFYHRFHHLDGIKRLMAYGSIKVVRSLAWRDQSINQEINIYNTIKYGNPAIMNYITSIVQHPCNNKTWAVIAIRSGNIKNLQWLIEHNFTVPKNLSIYIQSKNHKIIEYAVKELGLFVAFNHIKEVAAWGNCELLDCLYTSAIDYLKSPSYSFGDLAIFNQNIQGLHWLKSYQLLGHLVDLEKCIIYKKYDSLFWLLD
jgi:hypothetical protein